MVNFDTVLKEIKEKKFITFFSFLWERFNEHRIIEIGASLAYVNILSIFPFIIALINAIQMTNVLQSQKLIDAINYLPDDIAEIIINFIGEINILSSGKLLSISVIVGLWTVSTSLKRIIKNINLAYGQTDDRGLLKVRFISIIFTIALILMVILLFLTQVFGQIIINIITSRFGLNLTIIPLWRRLNLFIPLVYMLFTFALVYKYSPVKKVRRILTYKLILPGAIFSTICTVLATKGFGYYVGKFAKFSVTYGSLGGIIAMLIWFWILSIIILLGGEINSILLVMKNNS